MSETATISQVADRAGATAAAVSHVIDRPPLRNWDTGETGRRATWPKDGWVVDNHPEGTLFRSLPGAGPVLAPRLIIAFGTDRGRFEFAAVVQRLSGIAPVTERSGRTVWVHMRRACPKFLRQTFQEFRRALDRSIGMGESLFIKSGARTTRIATRPYERWPTAGSESFTAAGRTVPPTMSNFICVLWNIVIRR